MIETLVSFYLFFLPPSPLGHSVEFWPQNGSVDIIQHCDRGKGVIFHWCFNIFVPDCLKTTFYRCRDSFRRLKVLKLGDKQVLELFQVIKCTTLEAS